MYACTYIYIYIYIYIYLRLGVSSLFMFYVAYYIQIYICVFVCVYVCVCACVCVCSCRFIDNLQPTNSNVKLLQCYGMFLTSLSLTYAKVKISPTQPRDDPAHQRPFQETLHSPSMRWDRDPGITSPYVKT